MLASEDPADGQSIKPLHREDLQIVPYDPAEANLGVGLYLDGGRGDAKLLGQPSKVAKTCGMQGACFVASLNYS